MTHRHLVEHTVHSNIGITFTGLKEETGLANGVLQYHIHHSPHIEQKKQVVLPKDYCENCGLQEQCTRRCIINVLHKPLKREIVERLAAGKSQQEIADEMGKDKSTISYHVSRLEEQGVLEDKRPAKPVRQFLEGLENSVNA